MAAEQPTTRDVRFLFEGLFFFFFKDDRSEGSTGLLSVDPRHSLKIRIKRTSGDQEFILPLRTIRNLPKDISIMKTSPTSATADVEILGGWGRPESAGEAREIAEGMYTFGFIADFEGIDFHGSEFPAPILKRPGRLHPILRFNTGTFYTAKPSNERIKIKRGDDELDLGPLAEITGVKICLTGEDHLSCTIGSQTFSLDDVSVVSLEHICPKCPEGEDDMQLYYEVLDIPTSMRFTFYEPSVRVRPAICFAAGGSKTFGMP